MEFKTELIDALNDGESININSSFNTWEIKRLSARSIAITHVNDVTLHIFGDKVTYIENLLINVYQDNQIVAILK